MRKLLLALTAAALTVGASAQSGGQTPGGQTLDLTLKRALEIALSENPTIRSADMEIERFDYVRREAMGNHLPSLSAGGQYTMSIVKQEMSKGLSFGADNTIAGSLDLTLPLFVPAVYQSLKMTRTQQALAVEQARSSRIELTNAVTKGFFQTLLLERSLEVLRESERTISATVENTREMFEAGLASEFDLLSAEVQLSNLQPTIISTTNGVTVSKQMLKMYLSIPESVEIVLEGTLTGHLGNGFAVPDPAAALDGNSEIRQLDYQQTLVRQQIRLANTSRMPTLAAYGSFVVTGNDMEQIDFGSAMGDMSSLYTNPAKMINNAWMNQFGTTVPDNVLWNGINLPSTEPAAPAASKWWWQTPVSVGLSLSIPIFSGFKNSNKVKQLRNQVSQIELQKTYLREAKTLEVRTAVNNLVSARETMTANEKTVSQAEKAYSIARTRFDAGAGTMLEVNQAQLAVTQSRLNLSQAVYDLLAARADYDKVTGATEN
jgi:outer membrane protein TolC